MKKFIFTPEFPFKDGAYKTQYKLGPCGKSRSLQRYWYGGSDAFLNIIFLESQQNC